VGSLSTGGRGDLTDGQWAVLTPLLPVGRARAMFSSSPNVVRITTRTCQEAVVRANRSTASTVVSPRSMPI
jgi:transposase